MKRCGFSIPRDVPHKERMTNVVVAHAITHAQLFVTPWTAACQDSPSFTISQSLLGFLSVVSVMLCNRLILCSLLLLSSIFPSIRVFSNESILHISWPKHWRFSFSITSPQFFVNILKICKKKIVFIKEKNSEWPQKTSKTLSLFFRCGN